MKVSGFLVADFLEIDFYYKTAARMREPRGERCGCGLAHMCSPDQCFCRAKWASKKRPLKVCMFIVKNVCAFRKSLENAWNIQRTVLRKAFLSFSLRFCSACKMHYKTRLRIKFPTSECYFLHTSRARSSISKVDVEKTTVVRTRV